MLCAQCVCAQCDCAFNFSLWLLWHNNEYIILQLESPGMRRKGNIEKILSLCYSIVYYYNGAQKYSVLTGRSTVSGFDLAWFSALSSKCLCVFGFGLHGAIYIIILLLTSFSLLYRELSLVGLALDVVDTVLQCSDIVGWVIGPIKSSPK